MNTSDTNPGMSNQPSSEKSIGNKPDFLGHEKELSELNTQYLDLSIEEPSAELDLAVLKMAHAAAHGTNAEMQSRRKRRFVWIGALSTASILVIALSLVLQQAQPMPPYGTAENPLRQRLEKVAPLNERATPAGLSEELSADEAFTSEQGSPAAASMQDEQAAPVESSQLFRQQPSQAAELKEAQIDSLQQDAPKDSDEPTELNQTAAAMSLAAKAETDFRNSPGAWLNWITGLQERGELEQAQAELQAFKLAYPDFVLPPNFLE